LTFTLWFLFLSSLLLLLSSSDIFHFFISPKRNVFKVSMIHVEPAIHKKLSQFAAFFIETEVEIGDIAVTDPTESPKGRSRESSVVIADGPICLASGVAPVAGPLARTLGPQGLQFTFVHVRSRRIPCDWVREFGHDLSLANLGHVIEDTLTQPSSSS
jgi:hypothetical protein